MFSFYLISDTDFWHWSFFFDSFFRYCFFWFLGLYGSFIELRLQWFFLQWFFLWVFFWLLLWVSSFVIFWYCSFPILCFLPLCFFYSGFFFLFWFSSYSTFFLFDFLCMWLSFVWLMTLISFSWFPSYADSLSWVLWLVHCASSFVGFLWFGSFVCDLSFSDLSFSDFSFFDLHCLILLIDLHFLPLWIFWIVVFEITEKFYRKFLTFLRRILYLW